MHQLFVTTRPSRAQGLVVPMEDTAFRRDQERAWAEGLDLDLREITASTTETPGETFDTTSPSTTGTTTDNGMDIHADSSTDSTKDQGPHDYSTD